MVGLLTYNDKNKELELQAKVDSLKGILGCDEIEGDIEPMPEFIEERKPPAKMKA